MTHAEAIATMQLVARSGCLTCDGTGSVMAEDWKAFDEWRRRRPVATPEEEDDLVERYFLEVCDYSAVPPMGEPCEICGATGKVELELAVRDLLEFVLGEIDRPVVLGTELDALVDQVKKAMTAAALTSAGLVDGLEVGTQLRAVQEGAEALRSLAALRPQPTNGRMI